MKKTLFMLTVLALAVPTMAAVSIDVNDLGNGWAAIEYTASSNVSAFGLRVTVDGANTITDLNSTSYHVGESNSTAKGYGIFLGKIVIDGGGSVTSYGDPIAPNTDPGASGTGLGTSTVVLELGALYEDGNQPALSGTLCVLRVSDCTTMSVVGDGTRCGEVDSNDAGAVLEDGTSVVVDVTGATDVQIDYSCVTAPACFSCTYWSMGDADGNGWVNGNDVIPIANYFGEPNTTCPCIDVDSSGWINGNDVIPIATNFGAGDGVSCGEGTTGCP